MENLNKENFIEKIYDFETNPTWTFNGNKPAIVDFSADDWCAPCKMIAPILEELSQEYNGKIDIYKVNVDDQFELSEVFGIRSVPTIFFIPQTGEPKKLIGGISKQNFKKTIKEVMDID
jgi:thioredoxin